MSLNSLAWLYVNQGKYEQAEKLNKRALMICEKSLGPEDIAIGQTLGELAKLYIIQGQYDKAEPLMKRGLAIFEKLFGNDHPEVAKYLDFLGLVLNYPNFDMP